MDRNQNRLKDIWALLVQGGQDYPRASHLMPLNTMNKNIYG